MVLSFVCMIENEWPGHRHKLQIRSFFCVYLVCTSTSLLGIQSHNWIPLGENSSKFYLHELRAVSTMSHVIHSISFLNEKGVLYSLQSPSNTKYSLDPELDRLFVVSSYWRQRQDTMYWMQITQKAELSKHACAEDCGVERIRHYSGG